MGTGPKCEGCALHRLGAGFTTVEIGARYSQSRLLMVGEASGEAEAREGLPFRPYAQSGSLLADSMRDVSLSRADVAITNVIRCRPPKDWMEGAPWQFGATSHCLSAYLGDVIRELKPRAILALGGSAMRALTETGKGKAFQLEYVRGYARPGAGVAEGIPVVSTFHPAFLRRGAAHLTPLLQRDIKRAWMIAIGRLREGEHFSLNPTRLGLRYETTPSLSRAWEYAHALDDSRTLAFDTETSYSSKNDEDERTSFTDKEIKLIQFSQQRGTGIAFPWREEYIDVARYILAKPMDKVGANNWNFDIPVLKFNNTEVKGTVHDVMVMFHTMQPDLPANLQAIAQWCGFPFLWKHIAGDDLSWYGVADADATLWSFEVLRDWMNREEICS